MPARPVLATTLTAAVAAAATLVIVLTPSIKLASRSPSLHLVIETTAVLIAFMAALLSLGRYRQSGSLADLLLVTGLVVLGATSLVFAAVPLLLGATSPELSVWAPLTARLVGTALIAAAAFASTATMAQPWRRRSSAVAAAGCGLLFALLGEAAAALDGPRF